MSTPSRAYKDAIHLLNSLQSNAQTIEAIRKSGGKLNEVALREMREYLARVGYYPSDLNALNVIHVTGTKGKGSTSAFCDSLLRSLHRNHPPPPPPTSSSASSSSSSPFKIGLYTSPHLVAVRERIRINGVPLSEERFAKYFFEVWDRLEKNTTVSNPSTPLKPVYFRYLTLLAFHAFKSEKVDTTILEVGVGGAFDSTNIVPRPLATGITSLGLDHVALLGDTIGEVAWNKAGIFKAGVPALTVEQKDEAMIVLKQRAEEAKASSFSIVPIHPELKTFKLGLSGSHQLSNASLSLALIASLLASPYVPRALSHIPPPPPSPAPGALHAPLEKSLREGLERARWPGRCQLIKDPKRGGGREAEVVKWWLDGAHTVESLEGCGSWFWSEVDGKGDGVAKRKLVGEEVEGAERILIFNCTNGRSASSLLTSLLSQAPSSSSDASPTLNRGFFFDKVIFCTNTTYASGDSKGDLQSRIEDTTLTTQNDIAQAFSDLNPAFPLDKIHVVASIEEAIALVDEDSDAGSSSEEAEGMRASAEGKGKDVLVTGSLHLVGGVMEVAGLVDVGLRVD
ncbi:Mur ligase [Mrakia frigida]|uniref:tetrahydrofolate synthase n=1 Tax=Mrakia frigida TaxID=29902 RepID=UPI003FCBF632